MNHLAGYIFVCTLWCILDEASAFRWHAALPLRSNLGVCEGVNLTIPWAFHLDPGEKVENLEWERKVARRAVGARGKVFDTSSRFEYGLNAAVTIPKIHMDDSGSYTVIASVTNARKESKTYTDTVSVLVQASPAIYEGRLHLTILPEPVDVGPGSEANFHVRLSCGTFQNLGHPPVTVMWRLPSGVSMSSTTYQNGTFYLDVPNPVVSGLYSCEINPMDPALDCVARSSDLKVGDSVILNATDIQLKLKNRKMSDCKEVQRRFPRSGVYTLTVGPEHFPVYCDQTTDGGGWTVIQRRQDGSVNFDRTWQEYKDGFGHLTGEFWLGLDEMHWLTSSKNCSLRIDLTDFHGNTAYAEYDSVSIHGPEDGYRLVVSGYSGTAGDGLMKPVRGATQKWHIANNQSFSTPDHDRDSCRCNCAADRGAGWWYYVCAQVNLNARYTHKEIIDVDRLVWYPWKNSKTLKAADMKIRPKE